MSQRVRESINHISNIKGTKFKAILMGAVGAEGLNLENIRQVHVMEPYWHEIRIEQVIGRAQRPGRTSQLKVWNLLYENEV